MIGEIIIAASIAALFINLFRCAFYGLVDLCNGMLLGFCGYLLIFLGSDPWDSSAKLAYASMATLIFAREAYTRMWAEKQADHYWHERRIDQNEIMDLRDRIKFLQETEAFSRRLYAQSIAFKAQSDGRMIRIEE